MVWHRVLLCCSKHPQGRKTKQEQRQAPMFQTVVEMHRHDQWHVYTEVADRVDALLSGKPPVSQLRRQIQGKMIIKMHIAPAHGAHVTTSRAQANLHASRIEALFRRCSVD